MRKRDERHIAFAYDALGRLTAKTYPQGGATAVHYAYDLRGLQLSARFGSQAGEGIVNAYDGFGRLATSTTNISGLVRTLGYAYDRNGSRTRITHPDGVSFDTVHDGLGRPISLADPASVRFLVAYTPHGGPSWALRNNGTQVIFGYGPLQRLGSITMAHDFPGFTEDLFILMVRNPAGQISTLSRNNDAYVWTGAYTVDRNYQTNGRNQYTETRPPSGPPSATFTYDANGNLISDGTSTFAYDIENRLVGRSGDVALAYDPLGRLLAVASPSTYTRFLYDGDALVAEYDGNNAMSRRYVHNAGADVPLLSYAGTGLGQLSYLHAGHQGSIVAVSNAAGASAINTYDEYGIPALNSAGQNLNTGRFQYTGQIWLPEIGMYHYKARIYSPTLGRFLQTDPIGYRDQFNLYAYVGNDPTNNVDVSGKSIVTCTQRDNQTPRCEVRDNGSDNITLVFEDSHTGWDGTVYTHTPITRTFEGSLSTQIEHFNNQVATLCACTNAPTLTINGSVLAGTINSILSDVATIVGSRRSPIQTARPNPPATINGRYYTGHAQDRMQQYGIPPSAVEGAISNPAGKSPGNQPGTTVHVNREKSLQVVTNSSGGVVTVTPR